MFLLKALRVYRAGDEVAVNALEYNAFDRNVSYGTLRGELLLWIVQAVQSE